MKKIKSVEMALEIFIDAGNKYYEAKISEDDKAYKMGNQNSKIMDTAFEYLRDNDKIMELKKLLTNPCPSVKSRAAVFLLPIDEKNAIQTLEELCLDDNMSEFHRLEYETTLEEWRTGGMKKWLIPKVLGIPYDESNE